MPVDTAEDANSSVFASSVAQNIPHASVKTPHLNRETISLSLEQQLRLKIRGSRPVTPVRVDRFEQLLADYNHPLEQYLVDGFRFGFRINHIGQLTPLESPNLQSALQNPEILFSKLSKDLESGRIAGPFRTEPFPVFRTSPVGLVPKKTPKEVRLIHHLSYPKGSSVNDFIPDDCASVQYATISDAVQILKRLGQGCYLAKTDIQSAFRIIPVSPLDYPLLGIKWASQYYFDRCLAMGLKSSCAIFEKFSSSLEWLAVHHLKVSAVLHILDAFLFIAPSQENEKPIFLIS